MSNELSGQAVLGNSGSLDEDVAFPSTTPVATFTDANTSDTATEFAAQIAWGDGTTTTGTVVGSNGSFTVEGGHTYADEGDYLATVTITRTTDNDQIAPEGAVGVADTDSIVGQGAATITANPNQPFTNIVVATFTDANTVNGPGDFTTSIDWGDGASTAGTLAGSGGSFTLTGSHTYAAAGDYTISSFMNDDTPDSAVGFATTQADIGFGGSVDVEAAQPPTETQPILSGTQIATFVDNSGDPVGDYTATINWGDGTAPTTGVISGSNGSFTVSSASDQTYADEGNFTVTVTVQRTDNNGTATATMSGTVDVADDDDFTNQAGFTINGSPNEPLTNVTVANFTDTDTVNTASDFVATIAWGDGTTSAGTVSGGAGTFTVDGSHTYAQAGKDTITVEIADDPAGQGFPGEGQALASDSTTSTAIIGLMPGTASNFNTPEGTAIAAGQVASFTDGNLSDTAGSFTATINWGDGTATIGTVAGSNGSFTVSGGPHTYADEGQDTITTTVTKPSDNEQVTITGSAAVSDADVITASANSISGNPGQLFNNIEVGSFTDTYTGNVAPDFTATINWGDGTSSAGTISGVGGAFQVNGSHTYGTGGTYTTTVTASDDAPGTAIGSASATATINLAGQVVLTNATEGAALLNNTAVATFSDGTAGDTASSFTATINWGDGVSSTGTVSGSNGSFTVDGGHTYADEGNDTAIVTVTRTADQAISTFIGTVSVAEGDVLTGQTITVTPNTGQTSIAATFSDTDAVSPANDFTASIDWGDGTITSGTVSGGNGSFTVDGSHAYTSPPPFDAAVTLIDDPPGTATGSITATVSSLPPTVTGTVANQSTLAEAPVQPFSGVTIGDPNAGATDTLTITLSSPNGKFGKLSGTGLTGSGTTYQLAGTAAAITSELAALSYTPVNGVPKTSVTTTFDLSDQSSAFPAATTNDTTSVIDTDLAIPPTPGINLPHVANSNVDEWILTDGEFAASAQPGSIPSGYQVAGTGDFTGNGTSDILWQNPSTGDTQEWLIDNGAWAGTVDLGVHPGNYRVAGVGDFFGNGIDDVLWTGTNSNGTVATDIWELSSSGQWQASVSPGSHPAGYNVVGVGDFTGNGTSDILWQNPTTGDVDEWQLSNGQWSASVDLGSHPGAGWSIAGIGDFFGNGIDDILWTNSTSAANGETQVDIWELGSNGQWAASVTPGLGLHPAGYQIAAIGNFTGNGTDGVLWYDPANGNVDEWVLNNNGNGQWAESVDLGSHPGNFQIAGTGSFVNGNSTSDILWHQNS
jgi:hypothetical protein